MKFSWPFGSDARFQPEDRAAYWKGRAKVLDSELRAARKQLDNLLSIVADLKRDGLVMPSQIAPPQFEQKPPVPPNILVVLRSRINENSPTWDAMVEEIELRLASKQSEEEVIRWIKRGRSVRDFGVS